MSLSPSELVELRDVAIHAAQTAGELIEIRAKSEITVERKTAGETLASQVVTEVDREAEALILDVLAESIQAFGLGLLTEETQDDGSRFEKDYFWCIDPLDGTLPFVEGVVGYSVSIALIDRSGVPLVGVVYDPRSGDIYDATFGLGCRLNREGIIIGRGASTRLNVYGDRSSQAKAEYAEILSELEGSSVAGEGTFIKTSYGAGAAMNACLGLRVENACYFKLPKAGLGGGSVWDFAATACLYREAGAWVSDMFGRPLSLNPHGSCFMNEQGVLFATSEKIAACIRKTYTKTLEIG